MKLGIVIDSSAGLTKEEANKKGWHFLPLFLNVNYKEYQDGIDITPQKYYDIIDISANIKTSATPPGMIIEKIEKIKNKYDFIIIYGISKELSSQVNNFKTFLKDYQNVYVVNSKGVGYSIVEELEIIEKIAKEGKTKKELIEQIEWSSSNQVGVVIPKNMDWLVKGGRISASLASMANLFKIIPIVLLKDGKLHKYGKGRIFKNSVVKAALMLKKEVKNKEGKFIFYSANTSDLQWILKNIKNKLHLEKLEVREFPLVIVNHIGPNCCGIIFVRNKIMKKKQ